MPSFVHHNRTYTWPPSFQLIDITLISTNTKHHKAAEEVNPLPDIDDDPFAHFISPVNDDDDPYDVLSLSAGILPAEDTPTYSKAAKFKTSVAKKWARYVARHHDQLHGLYHEPHTVPRIQVPEDDLALAYQDRHGCPYKVELREPTRGRAQDLLTPERRRGRRTSRTLSGHRHSWREPSPELFTVSEEEEGCAVETDDGFGWRSYEKEAAQSVKAKARL